MRRDRAAAARIYLAVGCGTAIGSLLRFLTGFAVVPAWGRDDLLATALVNVAGSFAIMFFATLSGPDGRLLVGPVGRQFVMAGLCGGFTTFSAMSLATFIPLLEGDHRLAAVFLSAVVAGSLAAAWSGHALAARLNR